MTADYDFRCPDHDQESASQQYKTNSEFRRRRRIEVSFRERDPEPGEHRREDDDEEGIDRLEPGGADAQPAEVELRVTVGEQIQRTAGLFEAGPEHRATEKQDDQGEGPFLLVARQLAEQEHVSEKRDKDPDDEFRRLFGDFDGMQVDETRDAQAGDQHDHRHAGAHHYPSQASLARVDRCVARFRRMQAGIAQITAGQAVLDQPAHHSDAGSREAPVPAEAGALAERSADERAQQRADVDTHVEDAEAAIAPRIVRRIQFADHRADVRLQEAGSGDDEQKADEKGFCRRDCEHEVAAHDDGAADEDRPLCPEQAIGDPATGQGREVDERRIDAIDRRGRLIVEAHTAAVHDLVGHEQDQQRPHAVVAEAFPHLGEEKRIQAARVPEYFSLAGARRARGAVSHYFFSTFPQLPASAAPCVQGI